MFKRRKNTEPAESTEPAEASEAVEVSEDVAEAPPSVDETEFQALTESVPPGPYDSSAVPVNAVNRVDLGCMRIAGFTEMQLHFETDQTKSRFVSVVATYRDAALRLQPLAAPRSGGLWDDMREQITASITGAGGDIEEVVGVFGPELHGVVPAVTPDGEQVRQPIRLVAFEGPRWLLHGVFMGSAAMDEGMAELFEDVFRQTVMVRGDQPMAPGDLLPIVLPPDAQAAQAAQAGDPAGPPAAPPAT